MEKRLPAYNIQIWCGLRERYTDVVHTIDDVKQICQSYVNEVQDCVTITETCFAYVDGWEMGAIIGLISYPRFPREPEELTDRAIKLAEKLMNELKQHRITITTPLESIMLEYKEK